MNGHGSSVLEKLSRQMATNDSKKKLLLGQEIINFFTSNENPLTDVEDVGYIVDNCVVWINSSNFKISSSGLDILDLIIEEVGHKFKPYIHTVLEPLIDRLGDTKDSVRSKASSVMRKMTQLVSNDPNSFFEKAAPMGLSHKNAKVREEMLNQIQSSLECYGAHNFLVSKYMSLIVNMLSDQSGMVRDGANQTLVMFYVHVGERVRTDIEKKFHSSIPPQKLATILCAFDNARITMAKTNNSQESLIGSFSDMSLHGTLTDETDRASVSSAKDVRSMHKQVLSKPFSASSSSSSSSQSLMNSANSKYRSSSLSADPIGRTCGPSATVLGGGNIFAIPKPPTGLHSDKKPPSASHGTVSKRNGSVSRSASSVTGSNSSTAGAVDDEAFMLAFDEVKLLKVYNSRSLNEDVNRIRETLSKVSNDWRQRVDCLQLIRSIVLTHTSTQSSVDDSTFVSTLRSLDQACQVSLKDLRSQVVREICITLAFISQHFGNKADKFLETLLQYIINLIQNAARVMASSGVVCMNFIIRHSHSMRLVNTIASNVNSSSQKSKDIRRHCIEFVGEILHLWSSSILERSGSGISSLLDAIKRGFVDADSNVRRAARKAYWGFADHFPEEGELLLSSLDANQKRLIQNSHRSSRVVGIETTTPSDVKPCAGSGDISNSSSTSSLINLSTSTAPGRVSGNPSVIRSRQSSVDSTASNPPSTNNNNSVNMYGVKRYSRLNHGCGVSGPNPWRKTSIPLPLPHSTTSPTTTANNTSPSVLPYIGRSATLARPPPQPQSHMVSSPLTTSTYGTLSSSSRLMEVGSGGGHHFSPSSPATGLPLPTRSLRLQRLITPSPPPSSTTTSFLGVGGGGSGLRSNSAIDPSAARRAHVRAQYARKNRVMAAAASPSPSNTNKLINSRPSSRKNSLSSSSGFHSYQPFDVSSFDHSTLSPSSYAASPSQQQQQFFPPRRGCSGVNRFNNTPPVQKCPTRSQPGSRSNSPTSLRAYHMYTSPLPSSSSARSPIPSNIGRSTLYRPLSHTQNEFSSVTPTSKHSFLNGGGSLISTPSTPLDVYDVECGEDDEDCITNSTFLNPLKQHVHGGGRSSSIPKSGGENSLHTTANAIVNYFNVRQPQNGGDEESSPHDNLQTFKEIENLSSPDVGEGGGGCSRNKIVGSGSQSTNPPYYSLDISSDSRENSLSPVDDGFVKVKVKSPTHINYNNLSYSTSSSPLLDQSSKDMQNLFHLFPPPQQSPRRGNAHLNTSPSLLPYDGGREVRMSRFVDSMDQVDCRIEGGGSKKDQNDETGWCESIMNTSSNGVAKRALLSRLLDVLRSDNVHDINLIKQNFRPILSMLIKETDSSSGVERERGTNEEVVKDRVKAFALLSELVKHPSLTHLFHDFAELVILTTLQSHKSHEISWDAENCAIAFAESLPPEMVIKVVVPLISGSHKSQQEGGGGDFPVNRAAIKMLNKLIDFHINQHEMFYMKNKSSGGSDTENENGDINKNSLCVASATKSVASELSVAQKRISDHLNILMPVLLKAYDNVQSSVRKAAVFCIVSIHQLFTSPDQKEENNLMYPYLMTLYGSKLKLLNLYIKRSKQQLQQQTTEEC